MEVSDVAQMRIKEHSLNHACLKYLRIQSEVSLDLENLEFVYLSLLPLSACVHLLPLHAVLLGAVIAPGMIE